MALPADSPVYRCWRCERAVPFEKLGRLCPVCAQQDERGRELDEHLQPDDSRDPGVR